ncbi:hypothetical protein [Streptomyces sp. NBC_01236]|uniref:hypothetical protein n=1 Tax=Streptomyces sp. NBC_01236 TaxID=2903789 RepID=UPI002E156538|nr:hypothetical protein OG324_21360 [Streptomyces sp. NBC_01236]
MRGHLTRAATIGSLALAVLGPAAPAVSAAAQPLRAVTAVRAVSAVHTRTVVLPLSGTFSGADAEPIGITDSIRVTVVTSADSGGGGTVRVISTLDNATGTGSVSGAIYRFVGADYTKVAFPPAPITPVTVDPTFLKIIPPVPVQPVQHVQPVRVAVTVTADGTISDITASIVQT